MAFRRVHRNARRRNNETEVLNRIHMERALLGFSMEIVLVETLQDVPHMDPMLLNRIRKNKNIIKINDDANVSHIRKNIIHKMLEGRRSISQTKWHNQVFECTTAGLKSGKPFMTFGDADVVVAHVEINLGKHFGRT